MSTTPVKVFKPVSILDLTVAINNHPAGVTATMGSRALGCQLNYVHHNKCMTAGRIAIASSWIGARVFPVVFLTVKELNKTLPYDVSGYTCNGCRKPI